MCVVIARFGGVDSRHEAVSAVVYIGKPHATKDRALLYTMKELGDILLR